MHWFYVYASIDDTIYVIVSFTHIILSAQCARIKKEKKKSV